jgi:hypothetical protein
MCAATLTTRHYDGADEARCGRQTRKRTGARRSAGIACYTERDVDRHRHDVFARRIQRWYGASTASDHAARFANNGKRRR